MAAEKEKEKAKAPPAEGEEADPAAKKKKMILFGGIGAGVAALGAGAFIMLRSPSAPHEPPAGEHEVAEAGHEDGEKKSSEHEKSGEAKKEEEHGAKKEEKKGESSEHGKKSDEHGAKKEEGKEGKEGKEAKKEEKKDSVDIDFGQSFNLKTFHLNLGNPLENRFLRMEISVEFKGGDPQKAELEARVPQLRDAIVSVAGKKTREFLLGPDGKDQLRLEMLNRINQFMDRKVEAVYITDFLIE